MSLDFASYDPNSDLEPNVREAAIEAALSSLRQDPTNAKRLLAPDSSIIELQVGSRNIVVYVRATVNCPSVDGTGDAPAVLLAAADRMHCEHAVARVDLDIGETGIGYRYWGLDTVRDLVRAQPAQWNAALLRGHAFDSLAARSPRPAVALAIDMRISSGWDLLYPIILGDGQDLPIKHAVNAVQLAKSSFGSDEYDIFTCGCGIPGCAGIWEGSVVVHQDDRVLWWLRGLEGEQVYVFDRAQYITAIRAGLWRGLHIHRRNRHLQWCPHGMSSGKIRRALLRRNPKPEFPALRWGHPRSSDEDAGKE